jgi:hypothetical protein
VKVLQKQAERLGQVTPETIAELLRVVKDRLMSAPARAMISAEDASLRDSVDQLQASYFCAVLDLRKRNPSSKQLEHSTSSYDGVVTRETVRRDGVVLHVANVASRKPCSGLVEVVKLSVRNEPLSRSYPIYWAEIVPSVACATVSFPYLSQMLVFT